MKFLIAIGSREYSESTLRVGMQVARALEASVTIVYVGPKISSFSTHDVKLAQESLERWEFELPGVEVLEWTFNFLAENKYITPENVNTGFQKNTLVHSESGRAELFLQGTVCKDVNLIMRNGDIITELRNEVALGEYDVTIIGGSRKRRMAHDLVQYINSSIFVVKDYNKDRNYRLLLAIDDSKGTRKALQFGAMVASAYGMEADLLTVSKKDYFGPGYKKAGKSAERTFSNLGIKSVSHWEVGDPVEVIAKKAGDDHIIIMGVSHMNPVIKFFKGSKPLSVLNICKGPILIVK